MGKKIESACTWAEKKAADPSCGYSQSVRWGPSYDCSSFVITAWEQAGVPVKTRGATYTGNMRSVFMECGFRPASNVNMVTGEGVKRGDVMLNDASHTALALGNGKVVHARSSEGTTDTADNSGNEVRVQSFWSYPWNIILRYPESDDTQDDEQDDVIHEPNKRNYYSLEYGSGLNNPQDSVKAWQCLLNAWGYGLDADGEFGRLTESATRQWQEYAKDTYGADVEVNGCVDEDDWYEIINIPE